jgi:hypothetical protein
MASLDYAPDDALLFGVGDCDFPGALALAREIILDIGGLEAQGGFNGGLAELQADHGVDLEAIINSLGEEIAIMARLDSSSKMALPINPSQSPLSLDSPNLALMIKVTNDTLLKPLRSCSIIGGWRHPRPPRGRCAKFA